jgi:hypothetical protein
MERYKKLYDKDPFSEETVVWKNADATVKHIKPEEMDRDLGKNGYDT